MDAVNGVIYSLEEKKNTCKQLQTELEGMQRQNLFQGSVAVEALKKIEEIIANYLRIHAVDEIDASEKFVQEIDALLNKLEVPTLSEFGIDEKEYMSAIPRMTLDAIASGSPSHAPREYTADDIASLYRKAYK